ncbi:cytochrome-c peroxidase [Actibacterium lipolyticum]|uniref:Cytochrome c551 peroxidase n=1 Tax=Actibacterium lipolyticum TaxID=1524263 RepID=A0A238KQ70_9RHOB|nr:cytochrome c peroxidase [Actibacterium lipolyticum]SMX44807.1 Cytochrome c551 peroxidase precursor [Actibacterium lipolyticum]
MTKPAKIGAILTLLAGPVAADLPLPNAVFPEQDMAEVRLGQLLFYDPILSGNKQVSCATCHHPRFGTSDGLSLGLGDGGMGLGTARKIDAENLPEQRVPRNAPAMFNLGATEFTRFFHDGRLEDDPTRPSGIRTPLDEDMVTGFDNALSAQAMFPVLSADEMAGHYSENEISKSVRQGLLAQPGGAWDKISARIASIPDYSDAFAEVIGPDQPIRFTDISNAMAAFIAFEWRADNSPFDQHIRGEATLTGAALDGMELFYGKAQCATCHSGQFQTDHGFHAIAMPQIGPGKAARFESHARDTGRMRVTGAPEDAYRFRTPSLRNIAQTAPYGHDGAYATLEGVVRHHLDPVAALIAYDPAQAVLPEIPDAMDFPVMSNAPEMDAIARANELAPMELSDAEVAALLAFLEALTDPSSAAGRLGVPDAVPSGLPVD